MDKGDICRGGFTLPGEEGYEELTLELAKRWGADVIRDSDGTRLSPEILEADYGIYSTICIIRGHNEFACQNQETVQQTFLVTEPVMALEKTCRVELLYDFFPEQFRINENPQSKKYWQVYDRTENRLLPLEQWEYEPQHQSVVIRDAKQWHKYTVSFLAYRIWEEISMYNHVTNEWKDKEHLIPIDPRYPKVQEYLLEWLEKWCREHPAATVVRFTSMFYNFAWIWGSSEQKRSFFIDWASYDFTVSDYALEKFRETYGYAITAEDFVNQGKFQVTHMPASPMKRDWMTFINDFVIAFGKKLVDLVHKYGKKAYVFYDDSWVGTEPYHERFSEFGFDGMIKCVFSGYEVRLCSQVKAKVHEIRLHPYLFPVGLGGAPTFMEGGNPAGDARNYWMSIRRALLFAPIQRIGLGGYLHLVREFPDFVDYVERICKEFRQIRQVLEESKPYLHPARIAVLHYWGSLRSWTLSGHFHETYMHDLIHINEALAGLPFRVDFIDFEDVKNKDLSCYQIIINAGAAGTAWSGGNEWKSARVVEKLTEWAYQGGTFVGINEPSAAEGFDTCFRMSPVLGVDLDKGERICHGRWPVKLNEECKSEIPWEGLGLEEKEGLYITSQDTRVLWEENGVLKAAEHSFGAGRGIYLSGFSYTIQNARALEELLLCAACPESRFLYRTDNPRTQCAYYPQNGRLIVISQSEESQQTNIRLENGNTVGLELKPYGMTILNTKN